MITESGFKAKTLTAVGEVLLHCQQDSLEGSTSYLSTARCCAPSPPAACLRSGEEAVEGKQTINQREVSQGVGAVTEVCRLTASASAGSYQMWMYG